MTANSISVAGDTPSPKNFAAVASIDESVLLFGGEPVLSGENWDSQLYVLNTSSKQWSTIRINGSLPRGRSGHTLSSYNGNLYMWGGQYNGHYLNDLHVCNFDEYPAKVEWQAIPYVNQSPSPRAGHMSVVYNNKLYIFGGVNANHLYNDIWYFDFVTRVWNQVKAVGLIPPPRESCAASLVDDTIYVFGGKGLNGVILGDLYGFRLKNQRWYTFQNMGTPPSPRYGMSLTLCQNKLYVFGGESVNGKMEDGSYVYILDCSKIKYPPETPENEKSETAIHLTDTPPYETARKSTIAKPLSIKSRNPHEDHNNHLGFREDRRVLMQNKEISPKSTQRSYREETTHKPRIQKSEEKSRLLREILVRDTIISEMKKKEHWWRTEVSIVRYNRSENILLNDEKHAMLFDFENKGDDNSRILLEQLVNTKSGVRKMKNSVLKQAEYLTQNISKPENIRAAALEEAEYYKARYMALKSRDISTLNFLENKRTELLENRLRNTYTQKENVNTMLLDTQRRSQENHTARLLAEERASIAQKQSEVAQEAHQAALEKISWLYEKILKTEAKCREDTIKIANLSNSLVNQLSIKENYVDLSEIHIKMVGLEAANIKYRNEVAILSKELEEAQDKREYFESMLSEREHEYAEALIDIEKFHIELDLVKKSAANKNKGNRKEEMTYL